MYSKEQVSRLGQRIKDSEKQRKHYGYLCNISTVAKNVDREPLTARRRSACLSTKETH